MDKWQAFYATDSDKDKGKSVVATNGTAANNGNTAGSAPSGSTSAATMPSNSNEPLEGDSAQSLANAESV